MTDNITIPKRKGKQRVIPASYDASQATASASEYSPSSSTASSTSSPKMPASMHGTSVRQQPLTMAEKGKMPASSLGSPEHNYRKGHERRVSLLSESLSRSEHTVINIGDDERPRLITCVRSSQGFDWNQDIFLPSYMSDHDYQSELERRADPVQEIFVTDEEAAEMFPN